MRVQLRIFYRGDLGHFFPREPLCSPHWIRCADCRQNLMEVPRAGLALNGSHHYAIQCKHFSHTPAPTPPHKDYRRFFAVFRVKTTVAPVRISPRQKRTDTTAKAGRAHPRATHRHARTLASTHTHDAPRTTRAGATRRRANRKTELAARARALQVQSR